VSKVLQRLRRLFGSDRFWVMAATLAARGGGFLVGMLITRMQGTAGFGVYAATLNVAASSVSPLGQVLQNNAAMLSARRTSPPDRLHLMRVHLPVLLALLMGGMVAFALLAPHSGLPDLWQWSSWLTWGAALCVVFYQLQNAVAQGFLQGVGDFVRPAQWLVVLTIAVSLLAWPLIWLGGLPGAYGVLALNSLLPPLILLWAYLHPRPVQDPAAGLVTKPAATGADTLDALDAPSVGAVGKELVASTPFVLTALFSTVVSWLCLVFLANRSHGADGLGWVSLGAQWGTLMLVPCTSWGGLTMKHVMDAVHAGSRTGLRRTLGRMMLQNGGITLLTAVAVLLATPLLSFLYKVDPDRFWGLLAVTAVYAVLTALNSVYERLFFCERQQVQWLVLSVMAALVQVGVTFWVLPYTVMGVAAGMSAGAAFELLAATSWVFLLRPPSKVRAS
jgi:O-antigen/teichoic acid export membrane protein